ncbi:recombinase family protein [Peribacillus tepidiphilus]|uniref:recombinase family protein n=1 Tax=Peribacillus tepidiphilus TaxID=2652445 RepID=UPI001CDC4FAA|nr:recombinase family protein [Peribacillus tepidiphilus]
MYLRKSRADIEAEARGEGETLAKHKKALLKLANEQKLNIIKIYEEIVSGESLIHRPEMLKLLKEIENGAYDAVLCMDMDRLGRGGMREQGLILETFKSAKTKIITLRKTYDLEDEWDEEYSEFEAFMARKELKIITRRLQRGRIASVEAGNYIATNPPFGYVIKELPDGRTLEPHPEQAKIVRLIFEWYTHENASKRIGASEIANRLNSMGYVSQTGIKWKNSSVLTIIKNAVYKGRIQWGKKEIKKSLDPQKVKDVKTRPQEDWIDVKGKHEPLVSEEIWDRAQEILKSRYHVPYQLINGITNPLAGVIVCDKCGAKMVYRPYKKQKPHLKCTNNPRCNNKASNFELVEEKLLQSLKQWLEAYKSQFQLYTHDDQQLNNNILEVSLQAVKKIKMEIAETEKQRFKLHDLLERGIYSEEIFLERSNTLAKRLAELEDALVTAEKNLEKEKERQNAKDKIIPEVERVLDLYSKTDDPKKKNSLIKSVLEKAVYRKEKHQFRDDFKLVLYPKIPK